MGRLFFLALLCIVSFLLVIMEYNYLNLSDADDANSGSPSMNFLARLSLANRFAFREFALSRFESSQWKALERFVSLARLMQLKVIMIDPDILWKMSKDQGNRSAGAVGATDSPWSCKYLCSPHIALGVEVERTSVDALKLKMAGHFPGMHVSYRKVQDTRLNSLESVETTASLLSQVFISDEDVSLQVVLLYERSGRLWHGLCDDSKELGNEHRLTYCQHEHLFARFSCNEYDVDGVQLLLPASATSYLLNVHESAFLGCDFNNARHFYSVYGFNSDAKAAYFRSQAGILLLQAKSVLDRMGIKFWLSSGTCLGWYRQCDFIPHSKDVDIGIFIKDYKPGLIDALKGSGLKLTHRFGKIEDSFELSFKASADLKLDIFFFYKEKDHIWNGGTQAKTGKKFKYTFPQFALCLTEFVDTVVRVPCPARPYIEANYGPAWSQKVTQWDWKKSPPNVAENGEWPKEEWAQVIQLLDAPKT